MELKAKRYWEFLPSFSWLVLMLIPFAIQFSHFSPFHVAVHCLGVVVFGLALFGGDILAYRREVPSLPNEHAHTPRYLWVAVLAIVALQSLHLALMPRIPLIEKWLNKTENSPAYVFLQEESTEDVSRRLPDVTSRVDGNKAIPPKAKALLHEWLGKVQAGGNIDKLKFEYEVKLRDLDNAELSVMREESSKLLKVPMGFIYVTHTAMMLTPLVVSLLLVGRRYLPALGLFLFSLFYARATLATGPLFAIIATYLILGAIALPRLARWAILLATPVALFFAAYGGYFLLTHPLSILNFRVPRDVQARILGHDPENLAPGKLTFTLTDHFRLLDDYRFDEKYRDSANLNPLQKRTNFFAYRLFLAPVEVSHRWYTYYPAVNGSYLGMYGLTPSSRASADFQHPANKVGVWAYLLRFPNHYYKSLHAYTSADADAYARWGIPGLFLIAFLLFAIRWGISRLHDGTFLATGAYACAVMTLAMNLPNASIQAIFVAHGLAIFIGLLILLSLRRGQSFGSELFRRRQLVGASLLFFVSVPAMAKSYKEWHPEWHPQYPIAEVKVIVPKEMAARAAKIHHVFITMFDAERARPMPYAAIVHHYRNCVDWSEETFYLDAYNSMIIGGGPLPKSFFIKFRFDVDGGRGMDRPGDIVGIARNVPTGSTGVTIVMDKVVQ